jgi:hypothetical protein
MSSPADVPRPPATTAQQAIIRLALLAGALLFGAVIWWLARDGRVPLGRAGGAAPDPDALRPLRLIGPVLSVGAVAVAAALRAMIARTADPGRIASLRILAWAAGEAAALFGGVYWLLSGDSSRYVIGLIAMLATYVVVPLRAR